MAAAATMVMDEPLLSRLDRLDNVMRQLEEIKLGRSNDNNNNNRSSSPKSSWSSGTLNSDGHPSSFDFSPRSLEKHCRPIDDVIMETELKGTLIERLVHVEDKVLELCLQLEKELEREETEKTPTTTPTPTMTPEKKSKKGLKELVKSCVKVGKGRHKSRID